ncbi:MAG: site-specific integrase [Actinomycetota bacterium]|nr:site-specific integrase [Actinomycetota bacterium]
MHQHLIPHLGRRRLDQLAPQHVRAMHAALVAQGLAPATALKAHRVLAKALTDAQREGRVVRNVATLVDAPRKAAPTAGALTSAQARALLAAVADDRFASRWAAALLLGARQGELLGLQWARVDLEAWTVDLSWQLQRLGYRHGCADRKTPATRTGVGNTQPTPWPCGRSRGGSCPQRELDVPAGFEHRQLDGGLTLTRPKSAAGVRVVPLPEPMVRMLELRREESHAEPSPHGLVWVRSDGRPLDPREDPRAWHVALEVAGLPSVPLHAARHTAATMLMEAGTDPKVVMQILGHSSVAVSQGYMHVSLELARGSMDKLGRMLT